MTSNPFANLLPPADVARIVSAVQDRVAKGKAAGILWWDLAESHMLHAAAMVPLLPEYPSVDFSEDCVFRTLVSCGIDTSYARRRAKKITPKNPAAINEDRRISREWLAQNKPKNIDR